MPLLEPKEITITDMKGVARPFIISKIPFSHSQEIVLQYPTSALPKIGNIELHMQVVFKLLSYAAVPRGEKLEPLSLTTRELCDNHIPDLKTGMRLQRELAMYNWDFFLPEDLSLFWERLRNLFVMWNQETSTEWSPQLSSQEKPPSMNSEQSTA